MDNTIGATPQPNPWCDNWVEFFGQHRLAHQLRLAGDARLSDLGGQVIEALPKLMEGAGDVRPSILHGDLWSGNMAAVDGQPCIYDPACYYGHREPRGSFGGGTWPLLRPPSLAGWLLPAPT